MSAILTFTANPAVDASTTVDRVIAERKLRCAAPRFDPGGGGINVARVIHRLGGEATALFPSGGPTGELLQQLLELEGVAQRPVHCDAWTRQDLTVRETTSERQFRFVMPGDDVRTADWSKLLQHLRQEEPAPRFIVASGSLPPGMPLDGYAAVSRIAAERGSKLVLDTSGAPLVHGLRAGVYLVKPNLGELAALAGRQISDEEHAHAAARSIVESGWSEVVLVSLGAGGALLVTATTFERIVSPIVPVRSRVGAGDSLTGALVLALAQDRHIDDAARFGVAAGAAAVMRPGTELCHLADVERLYRSFDRDHVSPPGGWHDAFAGPHARSI